MILLKNETVKELKLNEESELYFKHLKKYYSNDAKYYLLKKDGIKNLTVNQIKKITGSEVDEIDVLAVRSYGVNEVVPPSEDRWSRSDRSELNNYDLKNNWYLKSSDLIILIQKKYNLHNKNNYEKEYCLKQCEAKKLKLQQKAYSIRAEKARQERERKRAEQEAQTNEFKKVVLSKITNMIKNAASQEKDKETIQLLRLKERISNATVIEKNIQDRLNPDTLLNEVYVKCKTRSKYGFNWYNTEFKVPFIELILEGAYSLMLKYFKMCNACDWWSNTDLFEIVEASDIVDVNINHGYIK